MRRIGLILVLLSGCGDDGGTGADESSTSMTTDPSTSTSTATTMSPTTATTTPADTGSTSVDETTTGLGESSSETMIPEVSYAGEVEPIFQANCGCHFGALAQSSLDLSMGNGYDNIVGVPSVQVPGLNRVESGSPSQSYLYLKLTDNHVDAGGAGLSMPRGQNLLEDSLIDTIRHWILGGVMP